MRDEELQVTYSASERPWRCLIQIMSARQRVVVRQPAVTSISNISIQSHCGNLRLTRQKLGVEAHVHVHDPLAFPLGETANQLRTSCEQKYLDVFLKFMRVIHTGASEVGMGHGIRCRFWLDRNIFVRQFCPVCRPFCPCAPRHSLAIVTILWRSAQTATSHPALQRH